MSRAITEAMQCLLLPNRMHKLKRVSNRAICIYLAFETEHDLRFLIRLPYPSKAFFPGKKKRIHIATLYRVKPYRALHVCTACMCTCWGHCMYVAFLSIVDSIDIMHCHFSYGVTNEHMESLIYIHTPGAQLLS